jgi:hypothetical protein
MKNSALVILLAATACAIEHGSSQTQPSSSSGKGDSSTPGGAVQKLLCSTGNFRQFSATLDGSGYDAGSGFVDVRDARVNDGYATASLICTGHRPEQIDCIGFWFDVADEIAEVTTANDGTGLTASHISLRGDLVQPSTSPWPCTMQ